MFRLIKVETKCAFKRVSMRASMIAFIIIGTFLGIIREHVAEIDVFEWTATLSLFLSAITGLNLSRDYSFNTIRNKIIVGHSRFTVYFSKQITAFIQWLMCEMLFICFYLSVFSIVHSDEKIDFMVLMKCLFLFLFVILSFSVVTTFISMTVKNNIGGVLPIGVFFAMLTVCSFAMEFADEKTANILSKVPLMQLLSLNLADFNCNVVQSVLISFSVSILFFFLGYFIFRKADLN